MNRACQSFIVGRRVRLTYGTLHGSAVQYIICRPRWEKKKKMVETRLIAVGCSLLWVSA